MGGDPRGLPAARSGSPDPLSGRLFGLAISVNLLPAALNVAFVAELILLAITHVVLIYALARRASWKRPEHRKMFGVSPNFVMVRDPFRIQRLGVKDSTGAWFLTHGESFSATSFDLAE